ncbi:hypothetical protein, partial [Schleiferilactobacillus harbinensis]
YGHTYVEISRRWAYHKLYANDRNLSLVRLVEWINGIKAKSGETSQIVSAREWGPLAFSMNQPAGRADSIGRHLS